MTVIDAPVQQDTLDIGRFDHPTIVTKTKVEDIPVPINLAPEITQACVDIRFRADILDDLERLKLANQNRLRQMTRSVEDKDDEIRGMGLDETDPSVIVMKKLVDGVTDLETLAVKDLQKAMKKHPLGPWVAAQRGVGEKQAARLLAVIGDPYWVPKHVVDRETGEVSRLAGERTVSALWAYCGLHCRDDGTAARRTRGQISNWSTNAKTRAWLIIDTCLKQLDAECKTDTGIADHVEGCKCSAYRIVVDQRRKRTAVTHPDWSKGHSLNDGMRVASKVLLRDLWRESRRIHTGETD